MLNYIYNSFFLISLVLTTAFSMDREENEFDSESEETKISHSKEMSGLIETTAHLCLVFNEPNSTNYSMGYSGDQFLKTKINDPLNAEKEIAVYLKKNSISSKVAPFLRIERIKERTRKVENYYMGLVNHKNISSLDFTIMGSDSYQKVLNPKNNPNTKTIDSKGNAKIYQIQYMLERGLTGSENAGLEEVQELYKLYPKGTFITLTLGQALANEMIKRKIERYHGLCAIL